MTLAARLIAKDRCDDVAAFLGECRRFWPGVEEDTAAVWSAAVLARVRPDFRANLVYGLPRHISGEQIAGSE
jgi:hypothetical protein